MGESKIDLSSDEVIIIGGVLEMRGIRHLIKHFFTNFHRQISQTCTHSSSGYIHDFR